MSLRRNPCGSVSRDSAPQRAAFTLVELLVVIGIIALLISILLPALNKARDAANSAKCLSNIRQIDQAILAFATDHKGTMPGSGKLQGKTYIDPQSQAINVINVGGAAADALLRQEAGDWLVWERHRDPVTGIIPTGNSAPPFLNVSLSATAKYLGLKKKLDDSEDTGRALDAIYRCPADSIEARPSAADGSHGTDRYSYTANEAYMSSGTSKQYAFADYINGGSYPAGQRADGLFTGKLNSIHQPSEKVLLICEDPNTISQGAFQPNMANWDSKYFCHVLSSAHDKRGIKTYGGQQIEGRNIPGIGYDDCSGIAAFADGHAGRVTRKQVLRKYSGDPNVYIPLAMR